MTLIVHAPNVHQGGGRALLLPLLTAASELPCRAILDERLQLLPQVSEQLVAMRVSPTYLGRLAGELRLRALAAPGDAVLCFGNLPPLFPVAGRISVFLQNRYLLAPRDLSGFGPAMRLRILVERRWLRARLRQVAEVIVQTPSMAREAARELGIQARVLPFLPGELPAPVAARSARRFDFLYVASGEPHKNHRTLVEAWRLLAREGLHPTLCLTLDPTADRELLGRIDAQAHAEGLRIETAGTLTRDGLERLYGEAAAFIYPSAFEAFGLPLLEAAAAGLPILAPELDYVRDVAAPAQTFDPDSPVSIARAVKRHLGVDEAPVTPIAAATFLRAITPAR